MKWHLVFRFKRATPSDPPQGLPRGGARGGIPQIIMCYVNFGVFNNGKSKNDLYFHIRVTPTPARAPSGGGLGGLQGVLSPILPNIMWYVNSGVFNSGEFKHDLHFHFGVPQPPQGRPQGGGLGGLQGVLSPILPNIMWYVNSGVLNSGKSKNDLHFHFRVPQPLQGCP